MGQRLSVQESPVEGKMRAKNKLIENENQREILSIFDSPLDKTENVYESLFKNPQLILNNNHRQYGWILQIAPIFLALPLSRGWFFFFHFPHFLYYN